MKRIQISGYTKYNRYPFLYSYVKFIYPNPNRILVFGCSTGEEILTIQEYFTESYVEGCDISEEAFAGCRKKKVVFFDSRDLVNKEPYDIIFANSVLCLHGKNYKDIDVAEVKKRIIETVLVLDTKLNNGGILTSFNSCYYMNNIINYDLLGDDILPDQGPVKIRDLETGKEVGYDNKYVWKKPNKFKWITK